MPGFVPDPSWPSIEELGVRLWGEPTRRHGDEVFFGAREAKKVNLRSLVWKDFEANEGGGYKSLHEKAIGPLPQRGNGQDHSYNATGTEPWNDIGTVYRYLDAAGHLVLEVIRTLSGRPRFRQRKPNGFRQNGDIKWSWRTRDIPFADRPLYRLPEVVGSGDATVFICEGEKDVDNVTRLGLIATTNSGGAGKWHPAYATVLQGRDVVVLPDNDEAGRDHTATVAATLVWVAASVRVLALPGLGHKGDVSDWLAAGGTRNELERLAREAPEWMPPPPPSDDGGSPPPPPIDGDMPPWEDEEPPPPPGPTLHAGDLITEQFAMRTFVAGNKEVLRFNHDSGKWLIWTDHFWRPDDRRLAFSWSMNLCLQLAETIVGRGADANRRTAEKVGFSSSVERGARAMPEVSTAQNDWDADPWMLGTPGGVVDLKTGKLREGRREDMISRLTRVTPGVMPECPTWDGFLDFAMGGDQQLIRFLQRYFGYCLTGVTVEEVFLFMFGPGGAGKGTMVETVAHILGDYASTVPMEVFAGQSWSPTEYYRAAMAGQRLIIANEPEQNSKWAEAFIKETTGGDTLSGRHPMGRVFSFKPTHKLAMQGNHMPRLSGRSSGMERRLRIMPFTRLPPAPDRQLKAKLLTEAAGILRWLIEGCLSWQMNGLMPPDVVLAAGNRYFEGQDAFARWVEDWCVLDQYAEHTPTELRTSFNAWARASGEDEMNGNSFSGALDQFACDPPLRRGKTDKKRWVRGIRITHDSTPAGRWQDL